MESLLNIYHYNMTSITFTVTLTINLYLTEIPHKYALRTYFLVMPQFSCIVLYANILEFFSVQ